MNCACFQDFDNGVDPIEKPYWNIVALTLSVPQAHERCSLVGVVDVRPNSIATMCSVTSRFGPLNVLAKSWTGNYIDERNG
jgi:hypothetical protein